MNLLYPFRDLEEALLIMYSYIGYAGVVFQLRCHEVLPSGQRVVEYQAGFTQDQQATVSLLDEEDCWANPLLNGQRVRYLWRFEVPNTDRAVLQALNQLYKLGEEHRVTDEEPRRSRR